MNRYNLSVSQLEFEQSPEPTLKERAIMARALGTALAVGVTFPELLWAVAEITPNARLRAVLEYVAAKVKEGTDIAEALLPYSETMGETFLAAIRYGEDVGNLDVLLLMYATDCCCGPGDLANQIGRCNAVKNFTLHIHQHLNLGISIKVALENSRALAENADFQAALDRVTNRLTSGAHLCNALALEDQYFDRLYLDVVKAGEKEKILPRVFELLAQH